MTSRPGQKLIYTIGHSTRTIADFLNLLTGAGITTIIDVRAIPRSRTNPQFNLEVLPGSLAGFGIGYRHIAALGGRRHRPHGAAPSPNAYWRNQSFRNYADYAMTEAFAAGMRELQAASTPGRCALMCSEAVWWRCHRRIIADYLMAEGSTVMHILGRSAPQVASPTPGLRRMPDGSLVYPA